MGNWGREREHGFRASGQRIRRRREEETMGRDESCGNVTRGGYNNGIFISI